MDKSPTVHSLSTLAVNVVAIKLPFDLQQRLLTFPFLHALRDKYPEATFHLITPKMQIEVLNLLPFKAFYHEFDEDEIKTVFDVHRFCVNAKIFNVDLFISLTNSFPDACLGLGLRAKLRLGFSDGWKTLVLNQKIKRPIGHHLTEDFFALYREHFKEEVDAKLKVNSRDLKPMIDDWHEKPYIAVNLSPLRGDSIEHELYELLSQFSHQKFVLFASEEQERVQGLINGFLAKLPLRNFYSNFVYRDWIELGRMLAFAKGVITFNGPAATFSAYTGTKTIVMYDSEDPQRTGPFYFSADVALMGVSDPGLANPVKATGVILSRKTLNMEQVFSKAMEFFRLR